MRPRITSEAFSATMIVGALVLLEGTNGMTEASTTRMPSKSAQLEDLAHDSFARSHRACPGRMMVRLAGAIGVLASSSSVSNFVPASARP